MGVIARSRRQPTADLEVFARGVAVDDEVRVKAVWYVGIDPTKELEKFLLTMASLALS